MNRWFDIEDTPIEGLRVLTGKVFEDHRGEFARLYCEEEFTELAGVGPILQINRSLTHRRGAVRGLHFQHAPHAETKVVRCLRGEVWDVAVDLRRNSPTLLHWHAETLSGSNGRCLLIPEGFAHGFQAVAPDSELLYLHTARYAPEAEGGLRYDDPGLAIRWPLPVTDLSERDAGFPLIAKDFEGLH